jgi:hypothetical protein
VLFEQVKQACSEQIQSGLAERGHSVVKRLTLVLRHLSKHSHVNVAVFTSGFGTESFKLSVRYLISPFLKIGKG